MKRAAIAALLSMACITACSTPRAIPVTPDPAKLAACPATDETFPVLPPLLPVTIPAGTQVTDASGAKRILAAPLDVVDFDMLLDRDEATAVFVVRERADKKLCRSAVQYVRDWSIEIAKKP
ncbi:hypothetical protein SAMN03159338_0543 [Sphingomonas sp. NFR04]|uniref:hypothetical protein n=1 Tax=Sphingomonas sp. NFR04 TaxID=1566283 RepID=UPI0008E9FD71|nr:hypothetical protein [Sphingomonas sp. NFR04]SFJ00536.1 hypothetical protein SAMN03159338_0543 [Sphingomonas sp. NFR04]